MATPDGRPLGPGFRALFLGSLVSNTGDGIRLAALPLLAAQLTASPLLVSAVTAAQFLPWVSVAPVGGVLVDRHDRRRMILVTQAWRGFVMLALALLVASEVVAIWHLCVVAFVITAGEILVDPSVVALVPTLVDDEQLDTANGRIASAEIVTNDFAGGPVGATAFGLAPWLPFLLDAASYLASLVPFRRLPSDPPPVEAQTTPAERPTLLSDAVAGLRFLTRHPILGPLTAATMVYYLGAATGFSLLVLLVLDGAGGPAWAFGVVLACGAVGAFIGTQLGGTLSRRFGTRAVLATATAVEGLALAAMALSTSVAVLAAVWFLGGLPAGVRIPVARSLQQRLTPNRLLGRVNVSARMFTRGIIVVGALASGALATAIGLRWTFVVAGAVELVAATLMARALRDVRPTPVEQMRG
ncbi:MAG TPA: MFS transporter [Ilumatobacteraceae bacterium]|nr:MFS transporter [Ilumatobacteraceae bacterium]HRB03016.1 MFS transporter [Ilumatobacteraceae bacterium]